MLVKGIFTTISGSIGGMTGSHNKGGQYLRARTTPTNPNTAAQQLARTTFTDAVEHWGLLTQAQRNDYEQYAQIQTWTNRTGDTIQLSGQQSYVGIYSACTAAGITPPTAPPTPNTRPAAPTYLSVTYDETPTFSLHLPGNLAAADKIVIALGRQIGPGQLFYKGPYTNVEVRDGDDSVDRTLAQYLPTQPVSITAGQRIPIRMRTVLASGAYSPFFEEVFTAVV